MPFICPKCTRKSLNIVSSIELPPDSRSDEITLQIVKCSRCRFEGLAVYQESRRGALDSESVDHIGYYANAEGIASIKGKIERCPNHRNSRCRCSAHRSLGRKNRLGRWTGLDKVHHEGTFALKLSK